MLGAKPISSLNENNDYARLANGLFETVRDDVLRAHPWNCAVKRVTLSPDAESDAAEPDYSYQYTLPSDWLRTLQVGEYGVEADYKIEGRKLLCDDSTLYLRYIYKNTQVSTWDSMLIMAMTKRMAAEMAYGVTKSSSEYQVRMQAYMQHLEQAAAVDGIDEPPETLGDFRLLAARRSSSGSW